MVVSYNDEKNHESLIFGRSFQPFILLKSINIACRDFKFRTIVESCDWNQLKICEKLFIILDDSKVQKLKVFNG